MMDQEAARPEVTAARASKHLHSRDSIPSFSEGSLRSVVYRENVLPSTKYLQSNLQSSSLSIRIFQHSAWISAMCIASPNSVGGSRSRIGRGCRAWEEM